MFETANWMLIIFLGGNPTQPVGPFFTQVQCDASYERIVKDYVDTRELNVIQHMCVPVPTEGD